MGYHDVRFQHEFEASSNPVLHLPVLVDKNYYLISTDPDYNLIKIKYPVRYSYLASYAFLSL